MPFAGYKDFDDCVRRNAGKVGDPKAYCAAIMRRAESGRIDAKSRAANANAINRRRNEADVAETPPRERTGWWKGHL